MFCSNCGAMIDENSQCCPQCGAQIGDPGVPVSAQQPKAKKKSKIIIAILACVIVLGAAAAALALWLLGGKSTYEKLYQALENSVRMDGAEISVNRPYSGETEEMRFSVDLNSARLQYSLESDAENSGLCDGTVFHYYNSKSFGSKRALSSSKESDAAASLLAALCSGKLSDKEFLKNTLFSDADASFLGISCESGRKAFDILFEKLSDEKWMDQSFTIEVSDASDAAVYSIQFRPRDFLNNCLTEIQDSLDDASYQACRKAVQEMDNETIRLRVTIQDGKITKIERRKTNTEITFQYSDGFLSSIHYEAERARDAMDLTFRNINKQTFDQNHVKSILERCSENPVVGTYTLQTLNGMDIESYFSSYGLRLSDLGIRSTEDIAALTLEPDGTFTSFMDGEADSSGTWSLEGDQITFTVDGENMTARFQDGEILFNESGMTMGYVRK